LIVVVTEKPSVARDIAAFLGAKNKNDGFIEGNGYQVTWAFGHLVSLMEPQDYKAEWKRWSIENLPMIPEEFQLKAREDSGTKKQLKIIWQLIKKSDKLICATDAGREGELIFRNILRILKCDDKPFERLWLSSLTPEAIQKAFEIIKPGNHYDNLYHAARCRSEADWIVGLNGTRNLTIRFGQKILWSMGRVQTPVLAMLADRDDEISTFKPEPFWELFTTYREVAFKHTGNKFLEKTKAEALLQAIEPHLFVIDKIVKKREKSHPPLLFDLTELQREMNRRFGLSANDTLTAAQALYESKYITYPRTDSQYLSKDMKERIPAILNQLRPNWTKEIEPLQVDALSFSNRILNDSKVSDHHAIIPTGRLPAQLPNDQQKVLDAIIIRLIAAFYPPFEKDVTTVEGSTNKTPFRARGVTVVNPGWSALYATEKTEKEEEQVLPLFTKGESGAHKPFIKEGKTTPPKHYNENTLLGAMATAGKQVDDEELKEALKERGLGTPATRASIIETLITRNYIKRTKKTLTITPVGRYLIAIIQDPQLKSAELTGNWEAKLKQIEKGQLDPKLFMNEIIDFTRAFLSNSDILRTDRSQIGNCPLCQSPIIKGSRGYGCSEWKKGCSFVIWSDYKGTLLTLEQIQRLIQRKISMPPLALADGSKIVLGLSPKGKIIELPLPQAPPQKNKKMS